MQSDRRLDVEFDRHAANYCQQVNAAVTFSGQDAEFFMQEKLRHLRAFIPERPSRASGQFRVLDVGCGVGSTVKHLVAPNQEVCGIDVSHESIERARQDVPGANCLVYDGKTFPFSNEEFDLVFAICVFHHVPVPDRQHLAQEMARVTRPGGIVALFEHNPWNPLTQFVVSRCELDADAVLLNRAETKRILHGSDLTAVHSRYILFFPIRSPIARAVEQRIGWLPLGAQYYCFGRKSAAGQEERRAVQAA